MVAASSSRQSTSTSAFWTTCVHAPVRQLGGSGLWERVSEWLVCVTGCLSRPCGCLGGA